MLCNVIQSVHNLQSKELKHLQKDQREKLKLKSYLTIIQNNMCTQMLLFLIYNNLLL